MASTQGDYIQQKASASENTALRAQVAAMQTQMQQIMGMLQQQQHKQSSSSRADPEATQMMDAQLHVLKFSRHIAVN